MLLHVRARKDGEQNAEPGMTSAVSSKVTFFEILLIFLLPTTPVMSGLRRRIFGSGGGNDSEPSSREESPAPAPKDAGGDAFRIIEKEKLDLLRKKSKKHGTKRRNAWIFGLGGLFGLFMAGFFASRDGAIDKLVTMAGLEDMNLDNLYDVLPVGLIRDVQNMQVRIWKCFLFP